MEENGSHITRQMDQYLSTVVSSEFVTNVKTVTENTCTYIQRNSSNRNTTIKKISPLKLHNLVTGRSTLAMFSLPSTVTTFFEGLLFNCLSSIFHCIGGYSWMQHFAFVLNKCACFSPQNQFIFYTWDILHVFGILASLYDCQLCSLIQNINENTDRIQKKKNIKTSIWQWIVVTFSTCSCSYSYQFQLTCVSLTRSWICTMIMVESCLKAYSLSSPHSVLLW